MSDDPVNSSIESEMLSALRSGVDSQITNYDGDEVWLGPRYNAEGKRTGITDCCYVAEPCEHHVAVATGLGSPPPTHRMIPGSHERMDGAECACGAPWDRWNGQCTAVSRG